MWNRENSRMEENLRGSNQVWVHQSITSMFIPSGDWFSTILFLRFVPVSANTALYTSLQVLRER